MNETVPGKLDASGGWFLSSPIRIGTRIELIKITDTTRNILSILRTSIQIASADGSS